MTNNNHKSNDKKNDEKFSSKKNKHDSQDESARAVLIQNPFKSEK